MSTVPEDAHGNTAVTFSQSVRPPPSSPSGGGPSNGGLMNSGMVNMQSDLQQILLMIQNLKSELKEEIKRDILQTSSNLMSPPAGQGPSFVSHEAVSKTNDHNTSPGSRINNQGTFVEVKSANNVYTDNSHGYVTNPISLHSLGSPNLRNSYGQGQSVDQPIPNQQSNVISDTKDAKLKVPIDYSTSLPTIIPLEYGNTSSEKFLQWKDQVISAIERNPKFTGILSTNPHRSWAFFCERNQSKYSIDTLENFYIECHQEIWGYIKGCLDPKVGIQLEREFQSSAESLTDLLDFSTRHPSSYKNAYLLLEELSSRFVQRSFMRTAELFQRLSNLQYNGNEDPKFFLQDFHECFHLGTILGDGWPVFDDRSIAMQLISKLNGIALSQVRSSIQSLEKHRRVTVKDIEEELCNWWTQRPLNHSNRPKGKQNGERTSDMKPYSNNRRQINRSQEGQTANLANDSSSNSKSSNPKVKGKSSGPHQSPSKEGQSNDDPSSFLNASGEQHTFCAIADDSDLSETEGADASIETIYPKNYTPQRHEMMWDTGATTSITPLEDRVEDIVETNPCRITTMGGIVTSKTVGTLQLNNNISIRNVRILPKASYTLFSLSHATANGYIAIFIDKSAVLIPRSKIHSNILDDLFSKGIIRAERKGNLWVTPLFKPTTRNNEQFVVNPPPTSRKIPKKTIQEGKHNQSDKTKPSVPSSERKESSSSSNPSPSPDKSAKKALSPSSQSLNALTASEETEEGNQIRAEVSDDDRGDF